MANEFLSRHYTVGEKRYIDFQITKNNSTDTVVVTEARYEILKCGELIKSGKAEVDGLTLSVLFEPTEKGCFLFRLFVTVPPETVEAELFLDVEE